MGNPNRDAGKHFEREIMKLIEGADIPAWRPRDGYPNDIGDILLTEHDFVLQAKYTQRNFTSMVNEAMHDVLHQVENAVGESQVADHAIGVAVIKRKQKPTAQAMVAMSLGDFIRLLTRKDSS